MPIHGDNSGCLAFLSRCAKAMVVAVLAGFVAMMVGGNEMGGCFVALFATPAVFIITFVFFIRDPAPPPLQRKLPELKKRPMRP
jgi:hypothetical protein